MNDDVQAELLDLIATYQSGPKKGQPINRELREVKRLLLTHSYRPEDYPLLRAQIVEATPWHTMERIINDRQGRGFK